MEEKYHKAISKLRKKNFSSKSDYELLREAESSCVQGITVFLAVTLTLNHEIYKAIGQASFWSLFTLLCGLLICFWLHRESKKYRFFSSLFEKRIGDAPLHLENSNQPNQPVDPTGETPVVHR